jgi:hypothetical protein
MDYSENFIARLARNVSSRNLKEVVKILETKPEEVGIMFALSEISMDTFVQHVFSVYSEGGMVVAS